MEAYAVNGKLRMSEDGVRVDDGAGLMSRCLFSVVGKQGMIDLLVVNGVRMDVEEHRLFGHENGKMR